MAKSFDGRLIDRRRRAIVRGAGSAVPQKVLNNHDFEAMVETSDEWITTRTGIKERHICVNGETTATLSLQASRLALQAAGVKAEDLDLIICATITPEMVCPATACFVQQGLGTGPCAAYDLAAACSGFSYAVSTAAACIAAGLNDRVLVIGAETLSKITDYTDRSSCILFGDGAGAVVLSAQEDTDRGVIYSAMSADGGGWDTIFCEAYGSRNPVSRDLEDPSKRFLVVRGRETYQTAVRTIVELIERLYEACDICSSDIARIIPHQMNARIIESVAKRLNLSEDKMYINIDRFGNTSAASIPLALDEALREGHLKEGDLVILVAFGAGLTWGVNLIRL